MVDDGIAGEGHTVCHGCSMIADDSGASGVTMCYGFLERRERSRRIPIWTGDVVTMEKKSHSICSGWIDGASIPRGLSDPSRKSLGKTSRREKCVRFTHHNHPENQYYYVRWGVSMIPNLPCNANRRKSFELFNAWS